jgi:hypothetical protein
MAAPPSQLTTTRNRSMTWAIGSAADEDPGFDTFHHPYSDYQ